MTGRNQSASERRQTFSKHQRWANTYLGLRDLELDDETALTAALSAQAADASHSDDLVYSASHWLFTRRILIPGARRLQDWARDTFAAAEEQILSEVNAAVPPSVAPKMIDAAHSARPSADATHSERLKTPSKRHGPSTLAETIERVRYLLLSGAEKQDVELRAAGDKLEANGSFKVGPGTKAVAVVTINGKPTTARFTLK